MRHAREILAALDTAVEVLGAFACFCLVLAGALWLVTL